MQSKLDRNRVDDASPHRVLTRAELAELGIGPRMVEMRVRRGGPWQLVLPGVIMLRNGAPTFAQRVAAALRYAGPTALVTGVVAAHLHGLGTLPQDPEVHVLVSDRRQRQSRGFVFVERTTRLPTGIARGGWPTAPCTRAVLDAARRMRGLADVESLLAAAVQRGLTTVPRLMAELDAGSRRGSALPRTVLHAMGNGVRSTAEARGRELARRSGLPPMRWNARLRTRDGERLPTPDGWIDDVGLAWEIDSFQHHLSPADFRRTMRRHNELVGHGIVVVHTVPAQIRHEPDVVLRELRAAYAQAAKRPRPAVVAS